MKRCFLFLILASVSFAQTKLIDSKVIAATVFKDRAMVTRSADIHLKKGENQVIFSGLTTDIKDETVRISTEGSSGIKILDVKVERKYTPEIRKEEMNDLTKQIDSLHREMQAATDQIAIYDSKKNFIESLKAESVKYANQKILLSINSTREWSDLLKFLETNFNEIYSGIRMQSAKRSELDAKIKALKLTMNKYEVDEPKNYKEIIVKLDVSENINAKVSASYMVNSASWYPIYDARVDTKTKMVEFTFYGMIRQSTGEDWNDIRLTFSTADPMSIKNLPELDPWYLDVVPLQYKSNLNSDKLDNNSFKAGGYTAEYSQNWGLPSGTGTVSGYITDKETGEPIIGANVILEGSTFGSSTDINGRFYIPNVPIKSYKLTVSCVGYNTVPLNINVREKNIAQIDIPLEEIDYTLNEVVVTSERPPVEKYYTNAMAITTAGEITLPVYSDVRSKEFTTTFELNTSNTIPSDNSPHKVTIAMNIQPIEFEYTSLPKILPKVYLKGKVVNNNNYPLLEGEINIFMDNEFVNKTHLGIIVPTDTLALALGIDESIKCEKTLKNRFVESSGLFSGKKRVNYEFEIRVVNNRKTKESITVIDQPPISKNEKINVELIMPSEEEMKINADQELVWNLALNPGETKVLPLEFYIELPDKTNIYGLE